jgi:putative chitinase
MPVKLTPAIIAAATGASLSRATVWVDALQATCDEYEINTPLRAAAFLAQTGHESGHLAFTREIWGPTQAQREYEPPSAKARELGNTEPGDGRRFCGRGLIQITGRANYARAGTALKLDLINHPVLLEALSNAARSAGWFWSTHGLNELADTGEFQTITRRINGGLNGEAERLALYAAAKHVLGV